MIDHWVIFFFTNHATKIHLNFPRFIGKRAVFPTGRCDLKTPDFPWELEMLVGPTNEAGKLGVSNVEFESSLR